MSQIQETFLFTPTSVPGCQLWLDAADPNGNGIIPQNNTSILSWIDKSSFSNNPVVRGTVPIYRQNSFNTSYPSLFFNTSQYFGTFPTYTGTTLAGFMVANPVVNNPSTARFISLANPTTADFASSATTAMLTNSFGTSGFYRTERNPLGVNYTTATGNPAITNVIFDGTNCLFYANGTLVASNPSSGSFNISRYSIGDGVQDNRGGQAVGNFCEIIIYATSITTFQRQQIEGYLAWKWGLQGNLPSDHPFKTYRPLAQTPFPTTIPPMPTVGQGQPAFGPLSLPGCRLWLDAADTSTISLSGANVTQWRDKSTSGYVFTQGTDAARPRSGLNTINGLNVLTNQGSQFLQVTNWSQNYTTPTIFCVLRPTNAFATWDFLGILMSPQVTGTPYIYIELLGTVTPNRYTAAFGPYGSAMGADLGSASITNTTYLFSGIFTGSSATNAVNIYGTPAASYNYTGNAVFSSSASGVTMYTAGYPSNAKSGLYAEIVLFNRTLSQSEYQQMEGYLAWKWGLQANLPPRHPYRNQPVQPFTLSTPVRGSLNQWIPTRISGCQLWFDAADSSTITLSGTAISQWRDKSSNAYSVSQSSGSLQPTYTVNAQNSLSGIQFTTATYLFTAGSNMPNFTSGSATSVFIAARNASTNAGWNILNSVWFVGGIDGTNRYHFSFNSYANAVLSLGTTLFANAAPVGNVTSNATPVNSNAILGFTASASSATIHTNGSVNTYAGVTLPNANNSTYFMFGDTRNLAFVTSNTWIFEMIGYNTQVTTSERQQIEGYLAWKWGLVGSLPATHPYKLFPPSP